MRLTQLRTSAVLAAALCLLAGVTTQEPAAQATQSPSAYLAAALSWIQANDVHIGAGWPVVRRNAELLARGARTPAGTYPAIRYVFAQLRDRFAYLSPGSPPSLDGGYAALYPSGFVELLEPGGPAARAGLQPGDRIMLLNDAPPKQDVADSLIDEGTASRQRRSCSEQAAHWPYHSRWSSSHRTALAAVAYRTPNRHEPRRDRLPARLSDDRRRFVRRAGPEILRSTDRQPACGWIIDLRQTNEGDLWSYLAAVGPILGEAKLGGFVYRDGGKQPWVYQKGHVLWNGTVRQEGQLSGAVYALKRALPPVALLLGSVTEAAGEAVAVAFAGRPDLRTFGDPTYGTPVFQAYDRLSDGAILGVSGAYSYDRTGRTYRGSILPDVRATTDWAHFGTDAIRRSRRGNLAAKPAGMQRLRAIQRRTGLPTREYHEEQIIVRVRLPRVARAQSRLRKSSIVRVRPSSSAISACHPSHSRARVASGRRRRGSDGSIRSGNMTTPASFRVRRFTVSASCNMVTSTGLPRLTGIWTSDISSR